MLPVPVHFTIPLFPRMITNLAQFPRGISNCTQSFTFFPAILVSTFYPEYSYAMNVFSLRNSKYFLWKVLEDKCEAASWFYQTQCPADRDTDRERTLLFAPGCLLSEDLVYENMREPEPEDCIQARDLMIQ